MRRLLLVISLLFVIAQPGWALTVVDQIKSTADHSKFKELKGPFKSGDEVTKACLSCHTEASKQVMNTRHWTWEYTNPQDGKTLGKKTMVNNFCIGNQSNEAFCQSCHIGYGWRDKTFDFKAESRVDCLICHNQGGYRKLPGMAGEVPVEKREFPVGSGKFVGPLDLALIAQAVGPTSIRTCGTCHFFGGGGDGVKHGDLDSSLNKASRDLDVHMATKGQKGAGFTCTTCHKSDGHEIAGSRIQMTASDPHGPIMRGTTHSLRNAASCQSCHGSKPHKEGLLAMQLLNGHTNKLACQACHIPEYARGGVPTKMSWDWSVAGRLSADGKPILEKDAKGRVIYDSKKGSFTFGDHVVPEYVWFNGKVDYITTKDKIDPKTIVQINKFLGSPDDPDARIWPVKRFEGKQPYDKIHNTLLVPNVAMDKDNAYWLNFDWSKALKAGAASTGLPYSGQYDFVKTEMVWPITHMIAPKEKSVACVQCHTSAGGRLVGLTGIYVPGRDRNTWVDRLGWFATIAALAGVLLHALGRVVAHYRSSRGVR
ncbi:tetrathionate reductase family octaheme c-type cytochrome [beta proteobacterium MWH-UniP1]